MEGDEDQQYHRVPVMKKVPVGSGHRVCDAPICENCIEMDEAGGKVHEQKAVSPADGSLAKYR